MDARPAVFVRGTFLALIAAACASCSPANSTAGREIHTPSTLPAPRAPVEVPESIRGQIETLEKGNADSASQALIELAPNAEAYIAHRDVLLQAAENAQGEMNLDVLRKAGPEYHAWHAKKMIVGPSRSLVILEWLGQKTWEAPAGDIKDTAASYLVRDVTRWIDEGRLDAWRGATLARDTVMDTESGIMPAVSMMRVLALHKRLIKSATNPATRQKFFTALCQMGNYLNINGTWDQKYRDVGDLYRFLRDNYPGQVTTPQNIFFDPYTSKPGAAPVHFAAPLLWEDYQRIETYPLSDLGYWVEASPHIAPFAARRFLSEYQVHPELTLSVVKRPSVIRVLALPICVETVNRDDFSTLVQEGRIFELLVGELYARVGQEKGPQLKRFVAGADDLLRRVGEGSAGNSIAPIGIEKGLVAVLLKAGKPYENDADAGALSEGAPLARLLKRRAALSLEAKRYLREMASSMLGDAQYCADLKPQRKADFLAALRALSE